MQTCRRLSGSRHFYVSDSAFLRSFHPNLPHNWDLPLSWSNTNGPQTPDPNPPTDTNRSYVFSPNGYPRCTQPEAVANSWAHNSYVCPDRAPIETFGKTHDHCWHLGCILPRVPATIVRAGDTVDTQATINDMEYASALGKPFFLACGIHRPHLPWHMPRQFWDMYPPTEEIALPKHEKSPTGMPPIAFTCAHHSPFCSRHCPPALSPEPKREGILLRRLHLRSDGRCCLRADECDGQTQLVAFNSSVPIPFPSGVMNGSSPAGAGRGCAEPACTP